MSKVGIKYFKEGKYDDAFRRLVIFVKNTKKTHHRHYYDTHKMIDTILEKHQISSETLQWLQKYEKSSEVKVVIAKVHYFGSGVKRDYVESVKFLKDVDTHYGLYLLGNMVSNGSGTKQDDKKALELFKKSVDLGDMYAQFTMGNHYKMEGDVEKAKELYRLSAHQGHTISQYNLGTMCEDKEAMKNLGKCVKKGFKKAIHLLGEIHERRNILSAIHYYRRVLGNSFEDKELCYKLISLYRKRMYYGWGMGYEVRRYRMVEFFTGVNDGTDGEIYYDLGMIQKYTRGDYLPNMKLGASLGNGNAMYMMAMYHIDKNDITTATKWLISSAEKESPYGLVLLGNWYLNGNHSLKKDPLKAVSLYHRCVMSKYDLFIHRDNPKNKAIHKLADIYFKGEIVPKNMYKALYYLSMEQTDWWTNCKIGQYMKKDPELTKEICTSFYHGKRLDLVDTTLLKPLFAKVKEIVEKGKSYKIYDSQTLGIVVSFHFDYLNKKRTKMIEELNKTSLYVKDLHDIIEGYMLST